MTPFDVDALVAMLLAFYPVPSAANLATARRERPEYFAGAVIISTSQDKIRLPDGRMWDLIFDSSGPVAGRRWQALFIDPTAPAGEADPFALEDGPLDPVDEDMALGIVGAGGSFEDLVTAHLSELQGTDAVLQRAGEDAAAFDGAARVEGSAAAFEAAVANHVGIVAALEGDDPGDLVQASDGHLALIAHREGDYDEPPPPDAPVFDPGDPPPDKGGADNPPPAA